MEHGHGAAAHAQPAGLEVTQGNYSLGLRSPALRAGHDATLRMVITDERDVPLTAYRKTHGKDLHLIVVSRDLATYQHLHPTLDTEGTWSVPLRLPRAGDYRVLADFTPGFGAADRVVLGADLAVAGDYEPLPLPPPDRTAHAGPYTVTLSGAVTVAVPGELTMSIARNGALVTDLQPYLGAYGHLVAFRSGDLAYLHVHPRGEPGDGITTAGPTVTFTATAPSVGAYRLFLDFQHEDKVHTAAFTVNVARD